MNPVFNPFFSVAADFQKQWTEALRSFSGFLPNNPVPAAGFDPIAISNAWARSAREVLDQGLFASAAATGGIPSFIDNLQQAAAAYTSLLSAWSKMPRGDREGAETTDSKEPARTPADFLKDLASGWAQGQTWHKSATDLMSTWASLLRDMGRQTSKGLQAGKPQLDSVQQFYESWLKAYESTIGRFINITPVGPARYELEKLGKSADTYLKYQAAAFDFYSKMMITGMQALEEVVNESSDLFTGEFSDEAVDEFYHLLMSVGERRYHELFTSPLFCQSLESMVSAGLECKKAWDAVAEEALKNTPIVTQSQADEMHKEIYLLKKRISQLERRIQESDAGNRGE